MRAKLLRNLFLIPLGAILIPFLALFIHAGTVPPMVVDFSGRLAESDGTPLSADENITVRIYRDLEGGSPIWADIFTNVQIRGGVFQIALGAGSTPLTSVIFDDEVYVTLEVGNEGEMTPRIRTASSAFSIRSATATYALSTGPNSVNSSSIQNGTLLREDVDTSSFQNSGAGLIPKGGIILWIQPGGCPAGFTRVTALDGRFPRGSETAGLTGGAENHDHNVTVAPHRHTHAHTHATQNIAEMPKHSHKYGSRSSYRDAGYAIGTPQFWEGVPVDTDTNEVGGNQGHNHGDTGGANDENTSLSGGFTQTTTTGSNLPPFLNVLFCQKD
jgi:hypothetical protein